MWCKGENGPRPRLNSRWEFVPGCYPRLSKRRSGGRHGPRSRDTKPAGGSLRVGVEPVRRSDEGRARRRREEDHFFPLYCCPNVTTESPVAILVSSAPCSRSGASITCTGAVSFTTSISAAPAVGAVAVNGVSSHPPLQEQQPRSLSRGRTESGSTTSSKALPMEDEFEPGANRDIPISESMRKLTE